METNSPTKLNLMDGPEDVITAADGDITTLLDEVFALEKKQEAAVTKAAELLGTEFGGVAECLQYKIQKDGTLLVAYSIAKPKSA